MMGFNIFYSKETVKELKKLDKSIKIQILKKLSELTNNSELGKPLMHALKNQRSIHIGKYRTIYSIKGNDIIIAKIEHRKSVYE